MRCCDRFLTAVILWVLTVDSSVCYSRMNRSNRIIQSILNVFEGRRRQRGEYKFPKVLEIDYLSDNSNTYLDEEDENGTSSMDVVDYNSMDSVTNVACRDNLGRPFPGFICPLMRILSSEYFIWRQKVPLERTCERLVDLNLHPCDHRTSSCVVLSLPNNHVLVGCVDDHSGKFVAPQNWYIRNSTHNSNYLFDFKVRNPLRLTQECRVMHTGGRPICMRNNIFYRRTPLVQRVTCCCKGDFCADVLFDQVTEGICDLRTNSMTVIFIGRLQSIAIPSHFSRIQRF
uniref:MSP domain-containing protein n=1 Tax=Parascaris univalens TaxID=6257 RepID=A0A915AGK8_PARUN